MDEILIQQTEAEQPCEETTIAEEAPQTEAPQPKKRGKKRIILAVVLIFAVAVLACLTVLYAIPGYNYLQAEDTLENGKYEEAHEAFLALEDFSDSRVMADEALYLKGLHELEVGANIQASETFARIPEYKDSAELVLEGKYRNAAAMMEAGEFDAAAVHFAQIEGYRDTAELVLECRYKDALEVLNSGEYDEAKQMFTDLDGYAASADQIKECDYRKALARLEKMGYSEAYQMLLDLGGYSDAEEQRSVCIYAWLDSILTNHSSTHAERFSEAVELLPEHYETVYSAIMEYIKKYPHDSDWLNPTYGWYPQTRTVMLLTLLKMLPADYEDTENLVDLYTLLGETMLISSKVFWDNIEFMKSNWSIEFVRDILTADVWIPLFLDGRWRSDSYYLDFDYDVDDNSVTCTHNMTWITQPYGVKYFDFRTGGDYVLLDKDDKVLARLFRFTMLDVDTMEVYCYQNEKTYTFTRN